MGKAPRSPTMGKLWRRLAWERLLDLPPWESYVNRRMRNVM
ncbi:hypothetical protein A2U01_0070261, partial [Trifolium medium]|nr:hypothetical protein [Trifolium medium]